MRSVAAVLIRMRSDSADTSKWIGMDLERAMFGRQDPQQRATRRMHAVIVVVT